MKIKEVRAEIIKDSREEETIEVNVNNHSTSAPSGKSKGKHEKPPYLKSIKEDVDFINSIKSGDMAEINEFRDLEFIEDKFKDKIGANSLFALESSILKALAQEKNKELWQILNPSLDKNTRDARFPRILSNTVGGGTHSKGKIKPDFQEFLVTCDKNPSLGANINKRIYEEAGKIMGNLRINDLKTNDENAWQTDLDNERVIEILKPLQNRISEEAVTKVDLGIDVAASQFWKAGRKKYFYKNKNKTRTKDEQIDYIAGLIKKYSLLYIEDPLDEEDFKGFSKLVSLIEKNVMIVGDDLTVTNLERVRKAIEMKAITGLIVKPNQTGSLIEVKQIIELCKKENIKVIVSHRSGETLDSTISDIAFAFQADFIKTPVVGEERISKVNRLKEIEAGLKK